MLLQQLMHELFSEIELLWMVLADRPELEGIDDADIQKPPCQARPAPTGLPADGIGIMKLIHDIDRASMIEVVMNCLRTADRNFLAFSCPAIECTGGAR